MTTTHTDATNPDVQHTDVPARAEYRPDEEVPLRVTLNVPADVREAAGGFEELTETVEYRRATDE